MRVRQLSPTGDFTFGASQLNFLNNTPQAVAQVVQTSLLLWLGEWYLDVTLGMQWLQGVLGKHAQETADVTIQDYILNVQGVVGISNFKSSVNADNRKYSATMALNTIYGETPLEISDQSLF